MEHSKSRQNLISSKNANELAKVLIGCYRKDDATDFEVYSAALVAMLSEYPEAVVRYITDPRTGLPSTQKWLPTIFEVRHACEEQLERIADRRKASEHSNITAENYDERALAYGKAHGFFVLRKWGRDGGEAATPAQWQAWKSWRESKGFPTAFMEAAGRYQVPSEWPEDFDREAGYSDRDWRAAAKSVVTADERREVIARVRAAYPAIYADHQATARARAASTLAAMCEARGVSLDSLPDRHGYRSPGRIGAAIPVASASGPPMRLSPAALASLGLPPADARPEPPEPAYDEGEF